jgi:hypothetical protein
MQEKNDPKVGEDPKKKQEWPETGKQGGEGQDDMGKKGGDYSDSNKKREGVDVGEDKP